MAVEVKHMADFSGRTNTTHTDGVSFEVQDGHLIVLGWDGAHTNVAVYAPKTWHTAVVSKSAGD